MQLRNRSVPPSAMTKAASSSDMTESASTSAVFKTSSTSDVNKTSDVFKTASTSDLTKTSDVFKNSDVLKEPNLASMPLKCIPIEMDKYDSAIACMRKKMMGHDLNMELLTVVS